MNLNIVFPRKEGTKVESFGKAVASLTGNDKPREDFFYIFYRRTAKGKFDTEELCKILISELLK